MFPTISSKLNDDIEILEALGIQPDVLDEGREIFKYIKSNFKTDPPPSIAENERVWYASLSGDPDYSIYDNRMYLAEVIACWRAYSRTYIRLLANQKLKDDDVSFLEKYGGKVSTVVDLGCGIGFTTVALAEIFQAKTYGTNMPGSEQWAICEKMFNGSAQLVAGIEDIKTADLVFASEYFEHISDFAQHLVDILLNLQPRFLVFANSFGARAPGHFLHYEIQGHQATPKQASKFFRKILKVNGYRKIDTGYFNGKPAIYTKEFKSSADLKRDECNA